MHTPKEENSAENLYREMASARDDFDGSVALVNPVLPLCSLDDLRVRSYNLRRMAPLLRRLITGIT